MDFGTLITNTIQSNMGGILMGLGILILLFFLFREILCWYWKINQITDLLTEIKGEIITTNDFLKGMQNRTNDTERPSPSQNAPTSALRDQPE